MMRIGNAVWPQDVAVVRELFREYAQTLGVDLGFQDFDSELHTLPGRYAPPSGALLLARDDATRVLGCVALRALQRGDCEMKRLFVRPGARGTGLGRALVVHLCDMARAAGYRRMLLDTLQSMDAAVGLYRRLGFQPVAPYVYNPLPGAMYMALELHGPSIEVHAQRASS